MKVRMTVGFFAGVGFLLFAGAAFAQARPSLEALTQAICEKADADGDSYRPKVCDARCDCLNPVLSDPGVSLSRCQETQPGEFEVDYASPTAGLCVGTCDDFSTCGPGFPACPLGQTCSYDDNPDFGSSCVAGLACTPGGGECGPNYSCLPTPVVNFYYCGGSSGCALNNDFCPDYLPLPTTATVSQVVPVTDPSGVVCDPSDSPPVTINSIDANECLAQVEAVSGLDCGFRCGNGLLDAGEGCDDGNETPGDGCDASCQVE